MAPRTTFTTRLRHFPLHARQQALDPLIHIREWVLAQDCPLCLIVQFQVYPIDREITATFLGAFDEVSSQLGSCVCGGTFSPPNTSASLVTRAARSRAQQVEQSSLATDVVIREIELGNADVIEGEIIAFSCSARAVAA